MRVIIYGYWIDLLLAFIKYDLRKVEISRKISREMLRYINLDVEIMLRFHLFCFSFLFFRVLCGKNSNLWFFAIKFHLKEENWLFAGEQEFMGESSTRKSIARVSYRWRICTTFYHYVFSLSAESKAFPATTKKLSAMKTRMLSHHVNVSAFDRRKQWAGKKLWQTRQFILWIFFDTAFKSFHRLPFSLLKDFFIGMKASEKGENDGCFWNWRSFWWIEVLRSGMTFFWRAWVGDFFNKKIQHPKVWELLLRFESSEFSNFKAIVEYFWVFFAEFKVFLDWKFLICWI